MSAISKQYTMLLNKYNRALALAKDLRQQIDDRAEQAAKREEVYYRTTLLAKDLCKIILAKDYSEAVLGEGSTLWETTGVDDLLLRATQSYRKYSDARAALMREISEESENRRERIKELETELAEMTKRAEGLEAVIEKLKEANGQEIEIEMPKKPQTAEERKARENENKAKSLMSGAVKKSAEAGDIIIEKIIDDDIVSPGEIEMLDTAYNLRDSVIGPEIPIVLSREKRKIKEQRDRQNAKREKDSHAAAVKGIDRELILPVYVIGGQGISEYGSLIKAVKELWESSGKPGGYDGLSTSRVDIWLAELQKRGIINRSIPKGLNGKERIMYSLSYTGKKLYKEKSGGQAKQSEWETILKSYATLDYGIGVMELAALLRNSGAYLSVTETPSDTVITAKDGERIRVSVKCAGHSSAPGTGISGDAYYIYERAKVEQAQFNEKINKYSKITDEMNLIANSAAIFSELTKQTAAWVEARGGAKALTGKKIRITTPDTIGEGKNPCDDKNWAYVWDLVLPMPVEKK